MGEKMWYQKRVQGKYNAKRTVFKGLTYDSGKEADYAQTLELLKKAKKIKDYQSQVTFSLDWNGDKKKHICNYRADFVVTLPNGQKQIHEVKGFQTELFRLKWRLMKYQYGDEYNLILIQF